MLVYDRLQIKTANGNETIMIGTIKKYWQLNCLNASPHL